MNVYEERIANLLKEVSESISSNFNKIQIEELGATLQQFASAVRQVTNVSFDLFTEEMESYIAELKESEKLSQAEFEMKYSYEMEVCKQLGRSGWVISEYSNPAEVEAWYKLLQDKDEKSIVTYFEGENGYTLSECLQHLEKTIYYRPKSNIFF